MAEPQRASSLPVAPTRPRPAPRRRLRLSASRQTLDETRDLSPPVRQAETASPPPPAEPTAFAPPAEVRYGVKTRRPALPSRTPGERVLIAVLLGGLALDAGALLTNAALSGADRLLGSAVFFGGLALLVLIEVCRRTGCGSR
jgi:hypothetical protein